MPSLEQLGFLNFDFDFPSDELPVDKIMDYDKTRDYPALDATTRLGIHLRFGTISIRECVETAVRLNQTWLNELVWREFFMHVLAYFPRVVNTAFKPNYDRINWVNNEEQFARWCNGTTGYPLVDAGMRQMLQTGFMHNRVRMVTASFLAKHLLIDWRWGEAWFAEHLLDYELSSNNGNWQWAAGCGCDAAPYFRIFNPMRQQEKFDRALEYVRRWVPEHGTSSYPDPVIDHEFARNRCQQAYKKALE
jgi:deoxyribodipyrimidine photo-lyase